VTREQLLEQLRLSALQEMAGRKEHGDKLRAVLRAVVVKAPTRHLRVAELRHIFRLAGLRPTYPEILTAVVDVFGATPVRPRGLHRVRGWRGLGLRVKPLELYRKVSGRWDATLEKEGLPQEPEPIHGAWKTVVGDSLGSDNRLGQMVRELRFRQIANTRHFEIAAEYLHGNDWSRWPPLHRDVWEVYSLEGLTSQQIAARVGDTLESTKNILVEHKARCGILKGH